MAFDTYLSQVRTFTEMDSHEAKLQKIIKGRAGAVYV